MSVFIIQPNLTIGYDPVSERFFRAMRDELEEHVPTMVYRTEITLHSSVDITHDDAVVVFNRNDQQYSNGVTRLLQIAVENEAFIYPVAMTGDERSPSEIIQSSQSFDVVDELRRRALTEANIETVATALARKIIAKLQPTLTIERMHLFLSHRRADGESIAAAFSESLARRVESHFRDLLHVSVGEDAQERIMENLRQSDAIIFFDTPRVGESDWVARELRTALSFGLPIIWIRVGPLENRIKLDVVPAGKPHFDFLDFDLENGEFAPEFIDRVIHKAFQITREFSGAIFDQIHMLKEVAGRHGIGLVEKDRRNMIYEVRIPRTGYRYLQRPMTQLVQFFGRSPKNPDILEFTPTVCRLGYEPHPQLGPFYDTALMLAPIPARDNIGLNEVGCIVDSFDEYLTSLLELMEPTEIVGERRRGVIISGAFPDCEPEHQQHLTDAVHAFVQAVLDRGGTVIFGAHPTFQHLIFDMGKRRRPQDYAEAIHVYVSKFFVTPHVINEMQGHATLVATDPVGDSREDSLTLLRKTMIDDEQAMAMVCLGGKTPTGVNPPGVDEEVQLAKEAGLPVFLIGSAGGRSAQIASELNANGWHDNDLNSLSKQENQELLVSLDYRVLANKIIKHIGL